MQSKRWVFTLNNYAESDFAHFHDAPDRAYVIIGKEVGESGTPYLQGYITFHKNKRLSPVKIIHPRGHWEIARESRARMSVSSIVAKMEIFTRLENALKWVPPG